jgi:hypothetical protein
MSKIEHVLNIQDEKNFRGQVQAIIELHDFIKEHSDSAVKEIARFMPPVDSRVVTQAILEIESRERNSKK